MTRIVLFDDAAARDWQPFSLTRPIGELLHGAHTFRRRAELAFGGVCAGHITDPLLAGFAEPGAAPVLADDEPARGEPVLYMCARAVPTSPGSVPRGTASGPVTIGGHTAGWYSADGARPPAAVLARCDAGSAAPVLAVDGTLLANVWDLITRNAEQLIADIAPPATPANVPPHVHVLGEPALRVGRNVSFEPNVVLDCRDGPVWLDDHVTVRAFARVAGPCYAGPHSTLLGGSCAAVTVGPHCKVRGEIEDSVVLGYSNKAHDGFIGHAYLGAWVNLGALTTNSDLKNNYGRIRLWTPHGERDTGTIKLGCLLGDHVKTGIGMLINTGTVIGAGSNLWGAALPPKYVRPFSWGSGAELGSYDLSRFLDTAAVVMARRDVPLSDAMRRVLANAYARARGERA